jgi:hypothetical protein
MTPCASPQSEITFEDLSKEIIVSKGGQSSRNQRSGRSVQIQSELSSTRGGTTQRNMEGVDITLILLDF